MRPLDCRPWIADKSNNRGLYGFFDEEDDRGPFCRSLGGVKKRLTGYGLLVFGSAMRRIENGGSIKGVCKWARRHNAGATEVV